MKQILLLSTLFLIIFCTSYLIFKFLTFSLFLSYFSIAYFLLAAICAFLYKNYNGKCNFKCNVVIPVFNEGKHIYKTIKSVSKSNYKNYFITVIDDGSTDDTKYWILKACEDFSDLNIKTLFLSKNKGKKHALYQAIKNSDSEIIITIDSDSLITKSSIKNIIKPFNDLNVAGVAGCIRVENRRHGIIPAMMDVIFVFSYEFLKSAQSKSGHVLCTPGALSAYRRSAVLPLLDEWLNQTFLGSKTKIGEDRALTSLLIKNDHKIVYQSNAIAYTKIPKTFKNLCKMLIRWIRGDIRENILMISYILKNIFIKHDKSSILLIMHYISFNLGIVFPVFSIPLLIIFLISNFGQCIFLIGYICLISLIWSIIPAMIYMRKGSIKKSVYAFVYGIFSVICLSWIPLYSLLTIKNNKWLTRESDN